MYAAESAEPHSGSLALGLFKDQVSVTPRLQISAAAALGIIIKLYFNSFKHRGVTINVISSQETGDLTKN